MKFFVVFAIACCVFSIGCQRKARVKQRATLAPTVSNTNPFDVAMDFLNNLDQYQPQQVNIQIIDNLRDWGREEEASVDWIADPMFSRLPKALKDKFASGGLATKSFHHHDALELKQAVWMRDTAQTVAKQSIHEPHIKAWLDEALKKEELSQDQISDLSLAYRLFDWTVRNIQLDDESDPMDILGGEKEQARRDRGTVRYLYYPWENLMYGHGDWLERSRVFILLARQLGINVVMLSADRGDDEPPQPWATGVLLGEELYLFDAKLGLPLPGQGGAPFSRLRDYVANPTLLDNLSAGTGRYRIVAADFSNLVANVDATPSALSQRMKQIETKLLGNRKLVLTVTPTTLAKNIRQCQHITKVQIWALPYWGYEFRDQFNTALMENTEVARPLSSLMQTEQQPFATRGPLMRGRMLQLRGFYRGEFDTPGASALFMDARLSNKELERFNIPFDQVPPDSPLVKNLPNDPIQRRLIFEARIEAGRQMALRSKDLATYWLGCIAADRNEFRVASDFFKVNVANKDSHWQQSARYNLARAYEAMASANGDEAMLKSAIELYEHDRDSPQFPGNLLRAARLKKE